MTQDIMSSAILKEGAEAGILSNYHQRCCCRSWKNASCSCKTHTAVRINAAASSTCIEGSMYCTSKVSMAEWQKAALANHNIKPACYLVLKLRLCPDAEAFRTLSSDDVHAVHGIDRNNAGIQSFMLDLAMGH